MELPSVGQSFAVYLYGRQLLFMRVGQILRISI
jgi:hypothetical protein